MRNGFIDEVRRWGERDTRIYSIILVGSYATSRETAKSDVDIVILTPQKAELAGSPDFIGLFGSVIQSSKEIWGDCTSWRVFYDDMEVEFGIVETSWIQTPLDTGTREVLEGGYKIILDKRHYFDGINL